MVGSIFLDYNNGAYDSKYIADIHERSVWGDVLTDDGILINPESLPEKDTGADATRDLINNAWGRRNALEFMEINGSPGDAFTNDYVAKMLNYMNERFEEDYRLEIKVVYKADDPYVKETTDRLNEIKKMD